jgi:hypothetical protein
VKRFVFALVLGAWSLAASAHDLAKGPNGGPVVDSAGHHIEMVAKGTELVLYLTEESDKPLGVCRHQERPRHRSGWWQDRDLCRSSQQSLTSSSARSPKRSGQVRVWWCPPPWQTAMPCRRGL